MIFAPPPPLNILPRYINVHYSIHYMDFMICYTLFAVYCETTMYISDIDQTMDALHVFSDK